MGRTTTHRIPLLLQPCTSGTSQNCARVEAEDRGTRSAVARETTQAMRKVSTGGEHEHRRHRRRRISSSLFPLSPRPIAPFIYRQTEGGAMAGFFPIHIGGQPNVFLANGKLSKLSN